MPSKRYKKALTVVDAAKVHLLPLAVDVLQKFPKAKFDETVELTPLRSVVVGGASSERVGMQRKVS